MTADGHTVGAMYLNTDPTLDIDKYTNVNGIIKDAELMVLSEARFFGSATFVSDWDCELLEAKASQIGFFFSMSCTEEAGVTASGIGRA